MSGPDTEVGVDMPKAIPLHFERLSGITKSLTSRPEIPSELILGHRICLVIWMAVLGAVPRCWECIFLAAALLSADGGTCYRTAAY